MWNTVVFSFSVVILSLVFGMILALLLSRDFRGRGVARTLLITPFLVMPTVSAVMWKDMLFNPIFGLIPSFLAGFGLPRVDFVNQYPMASVVAIVTWEWTPFMMLILLAGLQSLEQEHVEAAQIDGAGPLTIFRYVILPHLTRYVEIGVLLETLFVLNIFGEIYITTSGGPADYTTTLTFNIFLEAFSRWNVGRASAWGVFAVILANIIMLLFLRNHSWRDAGKGGRMNRQKLSGHVLSCLTVLLALVMFFPILWMILTSFKTEANAFSFPPAIIFKPILDQYDIALGQLGYFDFLYNTVIITAFSTFIALLLGLPAAYALAFYPGKHSNFTLLWIMSTRMLPSVGVIVPLYVIFKNLGLFDTYRGLIILYTAMNMPLVIWMMRSFLIDLPFEAIEAARIDGAGLLQEMWLVVLPMALPGLMSTILLCIIFTWNEFFLAFNLTITKASPLTVFIVGFKTSEGLFWAKMSAAATVSALPVIIAGWVSQRQLVRGLTAGAVK